MAHGYQGNHTNQRYYGNQSNRGNQDILGIPHLVTSARRRMQILT
jgi:hypothetical protein